MYIVFNYIKHLVIIFLIWLVAYGWSTYGCHKVDSAHMSPVIQKNSYVVYRKQQTNISDFQNGDIVLYSRRLKNDYGEQITQLTGRVVGKPGDRIKMEAGTLIRNGQKFKEAYLKQEYELSFPLVVVPKNHLYVLADQRTEENRDSRFFGPIPDYCIIGKVNK